MKALIIDSGATNSSWIYIEKGEIEVVRRTGFSVLNDDWANFPSEVDTSVDKLYFFGTGNFFDQSLIVKAALKKYFPQADIYTSSDSEAVAYALSGDEPGYIHIMGSGSSLNFWDGKALTNPVVNLGFIWEDYMSGYDIGKTVIRYWKEQRITKQEEALLELEMGNLREWIHDLYLKKDYKTSISKLSFKLDILTPETQEKLIDERINLYFSKNINNFEPGINHHFNGSIAKRYEAKLRAFGQKHNLLIGKVQQDPIQGLISYFTKKLNKE